MTPMAGAAAPEFLHPSRSTPSECKPNAELKTKRQTKGNRKRFKHIGQVRNISEFGPLYHASPEP